MFRLSVTPQYMVISSSDKSIIPLLVYASDEQYKIIMNVIFEGYCSQRSLREAYELGQNYKDLLCSTNMI